MIRLLVPVDGSPPALRAAAHVAARARRGEAVEAHLLNVQPPVQAPNLLNLLNESVLDEYYRAESAAALAPAQRLLEPAGVACQATMRVGRIGPAIADYAKEASCDEVVMGTRGLSAAGRLVLGSVANQVLHLIDVPVTLVGSARSTARAYAGTSDSETVALKVLVPVDSSDASDRAVRYAIALARRVQQTELVVVNVQPRVRAHARLRKLVTQTMIDDYYRAESDAATASAKRLLDESGTRYTVQLASGPIVPTILRVTREQGCGQIVMATRGAGAVANVVLGSVARQLAALSLPPVTLVK